MFVGSLFPLRKLLKHLKILIVKNDTYKRKDLKMKEQCSNCFMYKVKNYSFPQTSKNINDIIGFLWNIITECNTNGKKEKDQ